MSYKNIIGKFLTSASYIGLLLMFSYTSLFHKVIVSGDADFLTLFNILQATWSGFIVNIGLLLMLLIDFGYNKTYVPRWSLLLSIIAFGVLVLVYYFAGHARVAVNFNQPFNWPWLGMTLYSLFIIYLGTIKCLSLPHTETNSQIKETY